MNINTATIHIVQCKVLAKHNRYLIIYCCWSFTDENIQSKVKRHKARQASGRPKKESVSTAERPRKEPVLTVEPSVNSDRSGSDISKVCIIRNTVFIMTVCFQ